ncbi:MAG: hypothetical protein WCD70_08420 [Alphaproteobacteria bacterium]
MIESFVWLLAGLLVLVTVSVHYEAIMLISDRVMPWAQKHVHNRRVMPVVIAALMLGHIAEIWMFALALKLLVQFPVFGSLQGGTGNGWGDFLYLSSVDYTSLGDNGLRIIGPARAIVASETLIGMLMIAWSASFTYLKMEQVWKDHHKK